MRSTNYWLTDRPADRSEMVFVTFKCVRAWECFFLQTFVACIITHTANPSICTLYMHTCEIDSSIYEWKIFHNLHFFPIKQSRLTSEIERRRNWYEVNQSEWTSVCIERFFVWSLLWYVFCGCRLNITRSLITGVVKPSKWERERENIHAHEICMKHWSDFGFSESPFNILSTRFGIQLHECIWIVCVCVCVCVVFVAFSLEILIFVPSHIRICTEYLGNGQTSRRLAKRQQFIDDTYGPLKMYWKIVLYTCALYMCGHFQLYEFIIENDYLMTYHLDNDYFDGKNESLQ